MTRSNTIQWPARQVPFTVSPSAATMLLASSGRQLVVEFLHHNGKWNRVLNADEQATVRRLADGFGRTTNPDLIWDWSHVRDSSSAAHLRMAQAIRGWVQDHMA